MAQPPLPHRAVLRHHRDRQPSRFRLRAPVHLAAQAGTSAASVAFLPVLLLRYRRFGHLYLVTNNARFLILPGGPLNLGSRVNERNSRAGRRTRSAIGFNVESSPMVM